MVYLYLLSVRLAAITQDTNPMKLQDNEELSVPKCQTLPGKVLSSSHARYPSGTLWALVQLGQNFRGI